MNIDDLDTPVATVDITRLEANIKRFQSYLDQHHIRNRPHIKTHKIPEIAQMQVREGAVGITCQKLGEVEVMTQAGLRNVFLPYNILGARKLERLVALAKVSEISLTADSAYTVDGLSAAASQAGIELAVLVEFDTGSQRCGVPTPEPAIELAQYIDRPAGLKFCGLMTYPANEHTDGFVQQVKATLAEHGIPVNCVSVGGTAAMWQAHIHPDITEYRAAIYVYGDRSMLQSGAMQLQHSSLK